MENSFDLPTEITSTLKKRKQPLQLSEMDEDLLFLSLPSQTSIFLEGDDHYYFPPLEISHLSQSGSFVPVDPQYFPFEIAKILPNATIRRIESTPAISPHSSCTYSQSTTTVAPHHYLHHHFISGNQSNHLLLDPSSPNHLELSPMDASMMISCHPNFPFTHYQPHLKKQKRVPIYEKNLSIFSIDVSQQPQSYSDISSPLSPSSEEHHPIKLLNPIHHEEIKPIEPINNNKNHMSLNNSNGNNNSNNSNSGNNNNNGSGNGGGGGGLGNEILISCSSQSSLSKNLIIKEEKETEEIEEKNNYSLPEENSSPHFPQPRELVFEFSDSYLQNRISSDLNPCLKKERSLNRKIHWKKMTPELFQEIYIWEKKQLALQNKVKQYQIQTKFNVNRSTYYRWKKKYERSLASGPHS